VEIFPKNQRHAQLRGKKADLSVDRTSKEAANKILSAPFGILVFQGNFYDMLRVVGTTSSRESLLRKSSKKLNQAKS
jgi:hypothetical protein